METPAEDRTIKLLICDDHPMVRDGLRTQILRQPDFELVGEASNGSVAVERTLRLRPDVVLMDLRMPEMDGHEALRRIKAAAPNVRVLVLTTFSDDALPALRNGADGFLLKDVEEGELYETVRALAKGEKRLAPAAQADLIQHVQDRPNPLTKREKEVLELVAQDYAGREIARELWISEKTVKNHVERAGAKLGTKKRSATVAEALRKGLINPDLPSRASG
jgi:DNA-binding NarL/FixJ family response regulator